MKLIHAADFHLCASLSSAPLPEDVTGAHRERIWKAFMKIIDACKEEQTDILLLAGDLFEDKYAKLSDIFRITAAFESIPNTRVFISPGSCDHWGEDSCYDIVDFPENVHIFRDEFEGVEIPEHNCVVYGFGWSQPSYTEMPFSFVALDRSKTNILCLNCDVVANSAFLPVAAGLIESLNFDYAALGHSHKASQVKNSKIFYSGSPEPLGFGEEGNHGYFSVEFSEKATTVSFVSTASIDFNTVVIRLNGQMSSHDIRQAVLGSIEPDSLRNIYRVIFAGYHNPRIDVDSIVDDIREQFYCIVYVDRAYPDYDIKKLFHQNSDNIIGKYIQRLLKDASTDSVAYRALLRGIGALMYKQEEGGVQ